MATHEVLVGWGDGCFLVEKVPLPAYEVFKLMGNPDYNKYTYLFVSIFGKHQWIDLRDLESDYVPTSDLPSEIKALLLVYGEM